MQEKEYKESRAGPEGEKPGGKGKGGSLKKKKEKRKKDVGQGLAKRSSCCVGSSLSARPRGSPSSWSSWQPKQLSHAVGMLSLPRGTGLWDRVPIWREAAPYGPDPTKPPPSPCCRQGRVLELLWCSRAAPRLYPGLVGGTGTAHVGSPEGCHLLPPLLPPSQFVAPSLAARMEPG